jgi:hypothetical protein
VKFSDQAYAAKQYETMTNGLLNAMSAERMGYEPRGVPDRICGSLTENVFLFDGDKKVINWNPTAAESRQADNVLFRSLGDKCQIQREYPKRLKAIVNDQTIILNIDHPKKLNRFKTILFLRVCAALDETVK